VLLPVSGAGDGSELPPVLFPVPGAGDGSELPPVLPGERAGDLLGVGRELPFTVGS